MKIYEQKEMCNILRGYLDGVTDQAADEIERLQKAWDSCFNQLMSNETEQLKALAIKNSDLALKNEKLEVALKKVSDYNGRIEHELEQANSLNRIMSLNLAESGWTSVADEKPKGNCLVWDRHEMHTAQYTETITIIGGHFEFDRNPVTHWKPLPAKPIEE